MLFAKLKHGMATVKFLIILILLVEWPANAGTYYVDYNAANDSANGTSTSTPWKRCPGMQGFGGSYAHAIGDQFIFKGGVTWPTAVFPFVIANSGSVANNDYYGSSASYYDGGSWTRPIFDLNYTAVSSAGNTGSAVWLTGSNLTIYGLEIKGLLVNNNTNFNGYGVCSISGAVSAWFITVQNCYIHNWRSACPTAVLPQDVRTTDSLYGGVFFSGSVGYGRLLQCTIGWGEPPQHVNFTGIKGSGGCVSGGTGIITSNTFVGATQFADGGAFIISFNTFRNGTNSYDPDAHANAIYHTLYGNGSSAYIYNNVFHDLDTEFQTMLLRAGYGGATNTTYYVGNNLAWNVASPIDCDESGIDHAGSGTRYYVWNNTIAYNPTVAALNRGQTYHIDILDCRNNHWIADTNAGQNLNPIGTSASHSAYAPVGSLVDNNNLWHSSAQAAAAGYNIANSWAPQSASYATVGYGANLTSSNIYTADLLGVARGSSGAWDSGAYEYASEAAPAGPAITLGSGVTLGLGITIR